MASTTASPPFRMAALCRTCLACPGLGSWRDVLLVRVGLTRWYRTTACIPSHGATRLHERWQKSPSEPVRQSIISPTGGPSARHFSAASKLFKHHRSAAATAAAVDNGNSSSSSTAAGPIDPCDVTTLRALIARAHEKLQAELLKLKPGGRFNPELLEKIRVTINAKGSGMGHRNGSGRDMVSLGDVAQVLPRGRNIVVMVSEKDYLKPVMMAIQSSPYSLTPQLAPTSSSSDPSSSLELHMPYPSTTNESKLAAEQKAIEAGRTAQLEIGEARQAHQKRLRDVARESQRVRDLAREIERQKAKKGGAGKGRGGKKGKGKGKDEDDEVEEEEVSKEKALFAAINPDLMLKATQLMENEAKSGLSQANAMVAKAVKVLQGGGGK